MRNLFFILAIIVQGFFLGYGQTIKKAYSEYQMRNDCNETDTVCCLRYSIENTQEECLVVVLSLDELNDSIPEMRQIYRTLCRPYNHFSLSMFAWDPNISMVEPIITLVPQFFAKIIEPRCSFDILFETKSNTLRKNPEYGLNHIQILSEETLKNNGLKHFVSGVKSFKADYPYDFIVIKCEDNLFF